MKISYKIGILILVTIGSLISLVSHAATKQLWVGADKGSKASVRLATDVNPQDVTHLIIWNKDESYTAVALEERPVLLFDEDEMLVKVTTSKQELSFSLETVRKYTLDASDDQTMTEIAKPFMTGSQFSYKSNMLYFNGFKRNSVISIYSINGILVCQYKMGNDGMASISTADWKKGLYWIKTDSITYKILKK